MVASTSAHPSPLDLSGHTIAVTRAEQQLGEARRLFERAGAEVLDLPALVIGPPDTWGPLDDALTELEDFHWLVVSSSNGVEAVEQRPGPGPARGPSTSPQTLRQGRPRPGPGPPAAGRQPGPPPRRPEDCRGGPQDRRPAGGARRRGGFRATGLRGRQPDRALPSVRLGAATAAATGAERRTHRAGGGLRRGGGPRGGGGGVRIPLPGEPSARHRRGPSDRQSERHHLQQRQDGAAHRPAAGGRPGRELAGAAGRGGSGIDRAADQPQLPGSAEAGRCGSRPP